MNFRIITKNHAAASKIGPLLKINFRADWTCESNPTAWELRYIYFFLKPKTSNPELMTTNNFQAWDLFDMMAFSDKSEIFGTEFKLDWSRAPNGDPAQVQFIEIDYRRVDLACEGEFKEKIYIIYRAKGIKV